MSNSSGYHPPPCDQDIFKNGEVMLITDTIPSKKVEPWVQLIAEMSGQRVDWHLYAGRIVVKGLGDMTKAYAAMEALMPLHDALREEALNAYK